MKATKKLFFRHEPLPPGRRPLYLMTLILSFYIAATAFAQEKHMVKIKTFDQQLKPYRNVEVSVNNKDFIAVDNKGTAFVELTDGDLPLKSVRIKNEQLEAASWNYSKGALEVIIRKKNYQIFHLTIKDLNNIIQPNLKVAFKGKTQLTITANAQGKIEIPLGLDERITADQFSITEHNTLRLQLSDQENVLIIDKIKPVIQGPVAAAEKPVQTREIIRNFDLALLDSIQSLTVFYAVFKNFEVNEFDDGTKQRVDAKFKELIQELQDSIKGNVPAFIGRISDTSYVKDDLGNLLAQARVENEILGSQRNDFDEKIKIIQDKLASGLTNMDEETRSKLLSDLNLLEKLLVENEGRFFKNQDYYRLIISSLKEKFFDISDLENKLSESEKQRVEEQRVFRRQLLATLAVVFVFAVLIILLIYFSNKMRKQRKELSVVNGEIKHINENLESLVTQRTKLLAETNKELDTFLYKASHDLRSPISSIIGLCHIASHISKDESKELFEKVGQTSFAMDKQLKKLQIISEINNVKDFSLIQLLPIMMDIKSKFNDSIQAHNIKFTIDCPEDLTFYSDPALIRAILFNLIENALLYSTLRDNGHPEVRLSSHMEGDNVELSIYDNGIGVDASISHKLFDMFFKGNENSKGNGLGLYIVKRSAQALGGKVNLESEPGSFTKFVIDLPLKSVHDNTVSAAGGYAELQEVA